MISSVMHSMVRRRKNDFLQKAESCILHAFFADMYECSPNAIKNHNRKKHDGLHTQKHTKHATTLSGGEAQRVKLSEELSKKDTGKTIYILDEPTTGLHFKDIQKLLEVLQKLADKGNTVLIIEHNLDVIKVADHVIDVGPEGGNKGGTIVGEGTPEQVAKVKGSYTGFFLKEELS